MDYHVSRNFARLTQPWHRRWTVPCLQEDRHATGKQPVAHIGSEWKSNYEAAGAVADTTTSSIQLESTQSATSRQGYSEQTST